MQSKKVVPHFHSCLQQSETTTKQKNLQVWAPTRRNLKIEHKSWIKIKTLGCNEFNEDNKQKHQANDRDDYCGMTYWFPIFFIEDDTFLTFTLYTKN